MALPVPNGPGKTLRTNPGPCPVTACSARNRDWIQSATKPAKNEETGGPYCSVVTIDPWLRQSDGPPPLTEASRKVSRPIALGDRSRRPPGGSALPRQSEPGQRCLYPSPRCRRNPDSHAEPTRASRSPAGGRLRGPALKTLNN